MKKLDLFFATILVPIDYLALLTAGTLAYLIRYADFFAAHRPVIFTLPFNQYLHIVALVAIGWIVIFSLAGLYTIGGRKKKLDELKKIILACSTSFAAVLAVVVFSRELFESRFILLTSWILAIILVATSRLILRLIKNILHRAGIGLKRVAIIGSNPSSEAVTTTLQKNPKYGLQIVLASPVFDSKTEHTLSELANQNKLDQIIALIQYGNAEELHKIMDFAEERHIPFRYSADLLTYHGAGLEFDTLAGVPLMELKRTRLEGWGRIYKRVFDIVGSMLLFILTTPIMIIAALAILIETGLPIFFRNERVGEHGRVFDTLKFRTMYQKYCIGKQFPDHEHALAYEKNLIKERNEKAGPVYKIKNDPRVTRAGRFLRRTSIDELPQLFNVLGGKMTLVGPRPHQPREVEEYEKHHKRVLEIKPGMTGLPQISGRSDLNFEEEVKLDTYYIEHWSLKLDIVILIKTPLAVLAQKGTY